jgi:hypothetical protein
MASKKSHFLKLFFDGVVVFLLLLTCVHLGFKRVNASVDVLPRPKSTATPTPLPSATPRPAPARPISVTRPSRPMWLTQGEIHAHEGEYVCKVKCEKNWQDLDLEVLQATRGGEDWVSFEGKPVNCRADMSEPPQWVLHAGHWTTPGNAPEDSLCFLVMTESRQLH